MVLVLPDQAATASLGLLTLGLGLYSARKPDLGTTDQPRQLTLPPLAARYLSEPGGAVVYVTARSRAKCLSEFSSARRWREARARLRRGRHTVGNLAAGLARLLPPPPRRPGASRRLTSA